ncbi:MAG: DUF72 domain-containing protein [Planctomycetota bacterium]
MPTPRRPAPRRPSKRAPTADTPALFDGPVASEGPSALDGPAPLGAGPRPPPGPVRFGTSSFTAPGWVGAFYPEGTRPADFLRCYAREFDTVEVDATYYAVPSARTVDGWAEKTPEGFVVAAKFPRAIVHGGDDAHPDPARILTLDAIGAQRDAFLGVMARLGPRLGPLVLQFPYFNRTGFPSVGPFLERLDAFLGALPPGPSYAVEVRNKAWVAPPLREVLARHHTALVLVDQAWMPHGDEVERAMDPVTGDHVYVRLLGDRKAIEAITTTWDREVIDHGDRLARWAALIARLEARGLRIFVYVNNHYAGHAPATVRRLRAMYEAQRGKG